MDNRTILLNCTLDLFASYGYDAVGVQEIVTTAGITKPTLYHYFGSKRGLLDVLLEEKYSQLLKIIADSAIYNGDLPLTLYKIVSSYFNFTVNNLNFYRMSVAMSFSPRESDTYEAILPYLKKQTYIMENLFIVASNDHGNMMGRHKFYSSTLIGMVNTYADLCFSEALELTDR